MSENVPTLNDLRVKRCFICLEEEEFGAPPANPKKWVHPCQCSLISHESCLLHWIDTQDSAGLSDNGHKCAQCGTKYELVSRNPILLRALTAGDQAVVFIGKTFTIVGAMSAATSSLVAIHWTLTRYGAFAFKEFSGDEAFQLLLGDDPTKWPLTALINLPLIPISLLLSQFDADYFFPSLHILIDMSGAIHHNRIDLGQSSLIHWPPSPLTFTLFVYPLTRVLYRYLYQRIKNYIPASSSLWDRVWDQTVLRVRANPIDINPIEVNPNEADPNENQGRRVFVISTANLFYKLGYALWLPTLSKFAGELLLRLSHHSALLRRFLAPRPRWRGTFSFSPGLPLKSEGGGFVDNVKTVLGVLAGRFSMGQELDPVWWRNVVGLGLFYLAQDTLGLLQMWLLSRERRHLKIKNRNFDGIDISTLDLKPGNWRTQIQNGHNDDDV